MSTLKRRAEILLAEIQNLKTDDAVRKLTSFVAEETGHILVDQNYSEKDLELIKSMAVKSFVDFPSQALHDRRWLSCEGNEYARTQAYLDAVMMYLKSKGLIEFRMTYLKEKKNVRS